MLFSLLELKHAREQEWNNRSVSPYRPIELRDMMMVNIETQKERDIPLSLTIWLLGCSIIII